MRVSDQEPPGADIVANRVSYVAQARPHYWATGSPTLTSREARVRVHTQLKKSFLKRLLTDSCYQGHRKSPPLCGTVTRAIFRLIFALSCSVLFTEKRNFIHSETIKIQKYWPYVIRDYKFSSLKPTHTQSANDWKPLWDTESYLSQTGTWSDFKEADTLDSAEPFSHHTTD